MTPVQPDLALLPNAVCQAKEHLVPILESHRYDLAGFQTHSLPI